jgi:hypothetical protein
LTDRATSSLDCPREYCRLAVMIDGLRPNIDQ